VISPIILFFYTGISPIILGLAVQEKHYILEIPPFFCQKTKVMVLSPIRRSAYLKQRDTI